MRSAESYTSLIRIVLVFIILFLISVPVYSFLPVGTADSGRMHETLLICDVQSLPSSFINGSKILKVENGTEEFELTINKLFYKPEMSAATVTCDNGKILAIFPATIEGREVFSGDYVQMLTTTGNTITILVVSSFHEPLWYESVLYDQRVIVNPMILVLIWLCALFLFDSFFKIVGADLKKY